MAGALSVDDPGRAGWGFCIKTVLSVSVPSPARRCGLLAACGGGGAGGSGCGLDVAELACGVGTWLWCPALVAGVRRSSATPAQILTWGSAVGGVWVASWSPRLLRTSSGPVVGSLL